MANVRRCRRRLRRIRRDGYKAKFKFPFIMAVKGSNRHQILAAFETRIHNSVEAEFKCALAEINKIALFRLLTL
jgi:2-oxo-4-hydroxy-4-carboxy--5-ureidoimidazoline (OHCU) decarboxylase